MLRLYPGAYLTDEKSLILEHIEHDDGDKENVKQAAQRGKQALHHTHQRLIKLARQLVHRALGVHHPGQGDVGPFKQLQQLLTDVGHHRGQAFDQFQRVPDDGRQHQQNKQEHQEKKRQDDQKRGNPAFHPLFLSEVDDGVKQIGKYERVQKGLEGCDQSTPGKNRQENQADDQKNLNDPFAVCGEPILAHQPSWIIAIPIVTQRPHPHKKSTGLDERPGSGVYWSYRKGCHAKASTHRVF